MIANIFLPERVRSYQLLKKNVVGIDIQKTAIYATIVLLNGYEQTIKQCIEIPIETDNSVSNEERIQRALIALKERIGNYDALYLAIPSSLVIFKELKLPFTGIKKIKQVTPYEVESALPFNLTSASIDSIVTYESSKETHTMVAAVKKEYILSNLQLCEQVGLIVDKITVDSFELYGLFISIPSYQSYDGIVTLIDIGAYTTKICILHDKELKYIRSINKGIMTIAKKLQSVSPEEADYFLRSGITNMQNQKVIDACQEFINDLHFTVDSYTQKLTNQSKKQHCIITGLGSDIPGMLPLLQETFGIPTEILYTGKIIHNGTVKSDITSIPNVFITSIATALSSLTTHDFNLQQLEINKKQESLMRTQFIIAAALFLSILGLYAIYNFIKLNSLKKIYNRTQEETTKRIKEAFPSVKGNTLKKVKDDAERSLQNAQSQWEPLFYKNRSSFLKYLYELSRHINKKDTSLDLSSIEMDQNEIRLSGAVQNINAVKKLEDQLKSELFTLEESLQDANFKTKPIRLKINKTI